MADTLKRLEAWLSTLEAENQQSKKEAAAARAEAKALRQQIGTRKPALAAATVASPSTATAADTSTKLYNKASPMAPVTLGWAGLYAGAAGAVGWLHANQALRNAVASSFTNTGIDFNTFGEHRQTPRPEVSLAGNPGAMASLFVGYNYMLSSSWLINDQLEGTLSNIRGNLNGSSSTTFVDTSVFIPKGGAAETRTPTATGRSRVYPTRSTTYGCSRHLPAPASWLIPAISSMSSEAIPTAGSRPQGRDLA